MNVGELIERLQNLKCTDEVNVSCMGNELVVIREKEEVEIIKL